MTADAGDRRHEALGLALVVVQVALIAVLVLAGVVPAARGPVWQPGDPLATALLVLGWVLVAVGAAVAVAGVLGLGTALRASPVPAEEGVLRTGGPYAWVRHPVYSGLLAASAGWVLVVRGLTVLLAAALLLVLLWLKARWEERLLARRYPGYAAYAAGTPRFVPRRPRSAGDRP